ncbi:SUKH-3 domain-containing protein [Streptomyces sp. TRM 70351]|uniref:SUKH-3 domain-containing protein n=1 Tax=Streptomyces sp. TRM 70351 TaxID=3116552 RepID=UPI002E7B9A89|nr:SUKH-3 domain-containing protein [Streptomyces sp. TRM 70351]MEE1930956.1 SUKH-3 domain-containing protein [Streptomyces sp. TRM 70351]
MADLPNVRSARVALGSKRRSVFSGYVVGIKELADSLHVSRFPVGYGTSKYGLLLMDERGLIFYLRHMDGYFLGHDERDALLRCLRGDAMPDAEDFFV